MEKTLESSLDCKEIKLVNLKGNQLEYSLEGLMLKQKLQYFGHLMWRTNSLEKTGMLGKMEGRRRDDRGWYGWMAPPTWWIGVWASSGSWWWTGKPGVLQSVGLQRVEHDWVTELKAKCFKDLLTSEKCDEEICPWICGAWKEARAAVVCAQGHLRKKKKLTHSNNTRTLIEARYQKIVCLMKLQI